MYAKLFGTILDSSLWVRETSDTRVLFLTMLAMADEDGVVRAVEAALARRAVISDKACRIGLERLEAPDVESRSQEWGGRRIERIDGGWIVLNYKAYRELHDRDQQRAATRDRVRRFRQRQGGEAVTLGNARNDNADAVADAEGEIDDKKKPPTEALAELHRIGEESKRAAQGRTA